MKIEKFEINEISNGLINTEQEDIIYYKDFNPVKYNGNLVVHDIMLWLRNFDKDIIKINLEDFLDQTKINKDVFLTFISEIDKTEKINFEIELIDDILTFKLNKNKFV